MELWTVWFNAVASLRPACARWRTFAWMVVVLLGLSIRPELAGVTSIVRVLALAPPLYLRLLALFHSRGLKLAPLTELWVRWCRRAFTRLAHGPAAARGAPVVVGGVPRRGVRRGRRSPPRRTAATSWSPG